jgi:hypothetical protein
MPDDWDTISALLVALRSLGLSEEASRFEQEFEARNWSVTKSDVAALRAAIGGAPAPAAPDDTKESFEGARWDVPFSPFVDALQNGRDLLAKLDTLCRARTWVDVVEVLGQVFVDCLGYEAANIDVTPRLGVGKTLQRLHLIARHQDFVICAVESKYGTRFTSNLRPVFSLYPHSLVVCFEPARAKISFAFTCKGGSPRPISAIALNGPRRQQRAGENLVTWCRRMDLLRPEFEESPTTHRDRVEIALKMSAGDLATHWPSIEFSTVESPPGPSWETLPFTEGNSFVQANLSAASRIHWGLERVLCESFPMLVGSGAGQIRYMGHELMSEAAVERASSRHATHGWPVRVDLSYISSHPAAESVSFQLECFVITPGPGGVFEIDGIRYIFEPYIDGEGRFRELTLELGAETEFGEFVFGWDSSISEQEEEVDPGPERTDADDAVEHSIQGPGVLELLESIVANHLGGIARTLWRLSPGAGIDEVLRVFCRGHTVDQAILLCSDHIIRSALTEVTETRSVVRKIQQNPEAAVMPQSWACLDASSALPVGAWYPVSGARLHPAGALAVPLPADGGEGQKLVVSRESAFVVNPRIGKKDASPRDASQWIATPLVPWAGLEVGSIERADALLGSSTQLPSRLALRCRGEELVALVRKDILEDQALRYPWVSRTVREYPTAPKSPSRPELHVQVGRFIASGTPWLTLPATVWDGSVPGEKPRVQQVLEEILDTEHKEGSPSFVERVPIGRGGRVIAASVTTSDSTYTIEPSWRVVLETARLRQPDWLHLPDGRVARIQPSNPIDFPFVLEGDNAGFVPDVVIQDPLFTTEVSSSFIDGCTAEEIAASFVSQPLYWSREEESVEPDWHLRFRLLDGGGIPEGEVAQLNEHERRWLRLVSPNVGRALDRSEAVWNGGAAPWLGVFSSLHRCLPLGAVDNLVEPTPTDKAPVASVDPIRTQLHRYRIDAEADRDIGVWRCLCGALENRRFAFEQCAICGDEVVYRVTTQGGHVEVVELPISVIHPWRSSILATILGLTSEELSRLLEVYPDIEIIRMIQARESSPRLAAEIRIARETQRTLQQQVGAGLFELEDFLSSGGTTSDLVLNHVPVVPMRLRAAGRPAGSPRVTHAPLVERYRDIGLALRQCDLDSWDSQSLRTAAEINLCSAVRKLFGSRDSRGTDSLAGLLHRLWPATRDGQIETAIPGLARKASGEYWIHDIDVPTLPSNSANEEKNIVHFSTGSRHVTGDWRQPSSWEDRAALHRIFQAAPDIACRIATLDEVDLPLEIRSEFFELGCRSDDFLAGIVAREFFKGLTRPGSRPSALNQIFFGRLPLSLPSSAPEARQKLMDRFRDAISGDTIGERVVRLALWVVLGGWWRQPASPEAPTGWRYCLLGPATPATGTRAVPPVSSLAWQTMKSSREGASLVTVASAHPSVYNIGTMARLIAGLPGPLPRLAWWDGSNPEGSEPKRSASSWSEEGARGLKKANDQDESNDPAQAEPPPLASPSTAVLNCSVQEWLRKTP